MNAKCLVLFSALLTAAWVVTAQDNMPIGKEPLAPNLAAGKRTFHQYCASCHGTDARGEGPAAVILKTAPPDLTTLAKRHGGKFPYEYVFDVLRFGTRFTSHGSSDMPVWGPIFGSLENYNEAAVRKRINDLSDYLASLQQKES